MHKCLRLSRRVSVVCVWLEPKLNWLYSFFWNSPVTNFVKTRADVFICFGLTISYPRRPDEGMLTGNPRRCESALEVTILRWTLCLLFAPVSLDRFLRNLIWILCYKRKPNIMFGKFLYSAVSTWWTSAFHFLFYWDKLLTSLQLHRSTVRVVYFHVH